MVGNIGAVVAVQRNHRNLNFRTHRVVEERQQTCIGTLLIFITILFSVNFIMDLFKVADTNDWIEERRNEA